MFSIIIPTMQKDVEILGKLISELQSDPCVGEIIVIDNACKGMTFADSSKIRLLVQKENLFVNPAWNYGIEQSSPEFEYFGILNDDIIFQKNLLSSTLNFLKSDDKTIGFAGIDCPSNTPKEEFDTYPADTVITFEPMDKLDGYWGSAFFGKKSNYFKIPEDMKIFYGDHYLFKKSLMANRKNYRICNIKVKHLVSLTSASSRKFSKIFKDDRKACIQHGILEYLNLSFWQKLFSVHYFHNHYIFCFLGLRMKFKVKKGRD